MTICKEFILHTLAFEQAYVSDNWRLMEQFYDVDAVHTVSAGGPFEVKDLGPKAIAAGLGNVVHNVNRRFDVRIPQIIEGPKLDGDRLWMRFRLTFRREGLPELSLEGEHVTVHRGGKILEFNEKLAPGHGARVDAYLREHDAKLRPAGTSYSPTASAADLKDQSIALNNILVRLYGMAKSRQDVDAAMMVCHSEFSIDFVPFQNPSDGQQQTRQHLAVFFTSFPDFQAHIDNVVSSEKHAACWGNISLTHSGNFLGFPATDNSARLPFFASFDFKDGLLARERFVLDLATLCQQLDISGDVLLSRIHAGKPAGNQGAVNV